MNRHVFVVCFVDSRFAPDFVALLSHVGPVALKGCQVLHQVVSEGTEAVARDLLHQRGIERLVLLVFDLLETERCNAEWAVQSRHYALKTMAIALQRSTPCVESFVDCLGLECAALCLASTDRVEQECAVQFFEKSMALLPRVHAYVQQRLVGWEQSNSRFDPLAASLGSASRVQLQTLRGQPNNASRALRGAATPALEAGANLCRLKDCARTLHACSYWSHQPCPSADLLRYVGWRRGVWCWSGVTCASQANLCTTTLTIRRGTTRCSCASRTSRSC